ncbi:MAG: diphosphate--fructose-6-phosphate 1-phosphotransferase [Spirochaetes bacterium RBG_16_67_19]|nr:MAG: diphosphate--fructose-6-phosphate 1-phosphotransferase [Spirochaetes bacterium RBG_16_67_19]
MENLTPEDLAITSLGPAVLPSPLGLSTIQGDGVANYVDDSESVLYDLDRDRTQARLRAGQALPAFERAGPRARIFFDPTAARVAIVTCGGLCPGINNVIRSLVMTLHHGYGVHQIYGIRYGFQGFIPRYGHEPLPLDPEVVDDIHEKGGSILASSRGRQDTGQIVDCLEGLGVCLLFVIGGDGTLRGALAVDQEARRRGLAVSVICIPKTIDNDIAFVKQTFGLETAFAVAGEAIRSAHIEAKGAPNGVGIVKVMGRSSGFIAANAALALNDVNYVLVPEVPFDLEGPRGLFRVLEDRLRRKKHAVLVVAEGAGQQYVAHPGTLRDQSGNPVLGDIGAFLALQIKRYFKEQTDIYVNIKYIDPSYLVRSVPANAHDAIFCMRLGQNAVHAGLAGKTGMLVGYWNDEITHVPLALAASHRKRLSPEDSLWLNVLEATGQPFSLTNERIDGGKQ